MKHLQNRGGKFIPNLFITASAFVHRRNALKVFSLATFVALFVVPVLASCSKDETPIDTPVTRAITHEDSVKMGLIITVDTAWKGVIDVGALAIISAILFWGIA